VEIEWWSVDFKTGQRFAKVQVQTSGKLSKFISMGTEVTVAVRCSHDGVELPGWDEATQKRRKMLVAIDVDTRHIVWGGLIRRRTSGTGPWVQCSLDSVERYLNRRYINDVFSFTDADPAQIAADVLAPIAADLAPLEVDAQMTGNAVVGGYYDTSDNKRVGSLLEDLSAAKLAGGIEWTVDLEWADAEHTQLRYVVRIAPRLGTPAGVAATQWTMPGCVTDFTYIEDDGEETGANDTIALSSGEGDSKPMSTRYEATELLDVEARFERRFTPATSITSTETLDQYAEADHAATRLGLTQLTVTANLDAAPRVNLDWWMGDDIDVALTCDRFPRRMGDDGYWEAGYTRRLRTVGWELDLDARVIVPRIREAAV
jgi:hypothetical protein